MSALSRYASFLIERRFAIVAFLIPAGIRAIPEIIVGPYPIGWDIIAYYIPSSLDIASRNVNVWGAITSSLMYALVVPVYVLTKTNLVLIFKTLGPILYGLLGWSVFRFCQRKLNWSSKKALYAVLFISSYFVVLRVSWDAYEAELGLSLFLLAQSIAQPPGSIRSALPKVSLLSLAVLSNQLVGVLVFGNQLFIFSRASMKKGRALILLQFLPMAVFLLILYATLQTSLGPGLAVVGPQTSLPNLMENFSFLFYAYAFVIPLLMLGVRLRGRSVFTPWILVCILGLMLSILPGHVFQDTGYRWTLILSVPLLIIAYEGYSGLGTVAAFAVRKWSRLLRVAVLVSLASSAILFISLPAQFASPFYTVFPQYVPSSMVQSSLPFSDYPNVVSAMVWVNSHLNSDSVIITHQAFYGWARVYLSNSKQVLNSLLASPTSLVSETGAYAHVFTVWWVEGTGWFPGSFPVGAKPLVSFGDLAVYEYR